MCDRMLLRKCANSRAGVACERCGGGRSRTWTSRVLGAAGRRSSTLMRRARARGFPTPRSRCGIVGLPRGEAAGACVRCRPGARVAAASRSALLASAVAPRRFTLRGHCPLVMTHPDQGLMKDIPYRSVSSIRAQRERGVSNHSLGHFTCE